MYKVKNNDTCHGGKRWQRWKFIALAAIIAIGIGLASSTIALEGDNPIEPLGGSYEKVIVPKHRAIISFMDIDNGLKTYRGQAADIKTDLETNLSDYYGSNVMTSTKEDFGVGNTVFSQTQAFGVVPQTRTLTNTDGFMGQTAFERVPSGIVCTSYLTRDDSNEDKTELWMELTGRAENEGNIERIGRVKITGINRPHFKYKWHSLNPKAPASKEESQLNRNIFHDTVAWDWNNDGYTDWVVSYITNPINNPTGENDYKNMKVALLFIDGKSLYDSLSGLGNVKAWTGPLMEFTTQDSGVQGQDKKRPPNSIRMAIGDMDGDGKPEIGLYYTKVDRWYQDYRHNNHLRIIRLEYDGSEDPQWDFSLYDEGKEVGRWYSEYDSVAITMGDLDGDGYDEMAVFHGLTDKAKKRSQLYLDVYKIVNGQIQKVITAKKVGTTAVNKDENDPMPAVEASIADLDGDGFGELVHIHTEEDDYRKLNINIHKWPIKDGVVDLSDPDSGNVISYCISTDNYSNWWMDDTRARFSMDTGMFAYPDTEKVRKQIGLVSTSPGTSGSLGIRWGIFTWNATSGLKLIGQGTKSNGQAKSFIVPTITAADIDDDSMILGEPSGFTVYDNIEPIFIVQAPPRHWDMVSNDGKQQTMDAFAVLNGYSTSVIGQKANDHGTIETSTSAGTFGSASGFTLTQTHIVREPAKMLETGVKYLKETASKNTESETVTITSFLTATAQYDDQIYYRANTHDVWRYPVLFPESQASVIDEGQEYRRFVQFIVPKKIESTFAPTPGKEIDWYEPNHNGLNLFSYPKKLKDTRDYPLGAANKPNDFWKDINGLVLAESLGQIMGNVDPTSSNFTMKVRSHEEDLSTLKNTVSGYGNSNLPARGFAYKRIYSTNLSGDSSYSTDSITTSDQSKLGGVTVSWPGVSSYISPSGMTPGDQQFKVDAAIYTSDSGVLSVAYAVPNLYKKYSAIWGDTSPYNETADPALNLPRKWVINGGKWQANPFSGDAKRIRGLVFDEGDIVSKNGSSVQVFPINTEIKTKIRVYNYSFIKTDKVTVTFSFQKITPGYRDPDITKATPIQWKTIGFIPGRDNGTSDNWYDLPITFMTDSTQTVGYLHITLTTDGGNLQTNNDHGHLLVGVYDPDKLSVSPIKPTNRSKGPRFLESQSNGRSLTIIPDSMSVLPLNADGSFGSETTTLAPGKTAIIQATIKFTDKNTNQKSALLNSSVFLRNASGFVSQRNIPMLQNGEEYLVQMLYTAPDTPQTIPLRMILSSPVLPAALDTNPAGRTATRVLNAENSNGCSVGFAPITILLALSMALFYKKRR
ncbi:MAG: hypothetical protein GX672_05260 [Synergistaceae bacterium]|nr:hypothetical protein [Synergistaceae bacterium]